MAVHSKGDQSTFTSITLDYKTKGTCTLETVIHIELISILASLQRASWLASSAIFLGHASRQVYLKQHRWVDNEIASLPHSQLLGCAHVV